MTLIYKHIISWLRNTYQLVVLLTLISILFNACQEKTLPPNFSSEVVIINDQIYDIEFQTVKINSRIKIKEISLKFFISLLIYLED